MSETVTIPLGTYLELKKLKDNFDSQSETFAVWNGNSWGIDKFVTKDEYVLKLQEEIKLQANRIFDLNKESIKLELEIKNFEVKSFVGKAFHSFKKNSPD
jgi:hypothetical protein